MLTFLKRPFSIRLIISVLICSLGIFLELQFQSVIPGKFTIIYPFLFFILYVAGFFPAIVSIIFYALITNFFPYSTNSIGVTAGQVEVVFFSVTTFLIAIIIEHKRKLENRLKTQAIELENALKTRDEFLSIASHELKTPLTSLMLHSQHFMRLIEQGDPNAYSPQRVEVLAKQVEKQVSKLNRLVDDMLDISQIQAGKLRIETEEFNFTDLINDVEEIIQTPFNTSSYPQPIIENNYDNVLVKWDKVRIEQVLINLLTNAIRYGEEKPIILNTTIDDHKISITVKDHGIGISEEDINKIFNCYEKINTISEVSRLGLGLFISKQIIEAHQGKLTVESTPGVGSVFKVELPR